MIVPEKIAAAAGVGIRAAGAKIRPLISAPAGWRHCQRLNQKKPFRHLCILAKAIGFRAVHVRPAAGLCGMLGLGLFGKAHRPMIQGLWQSMRP